MWTKTNGVIHPTTQADKLAVNSNYALYPLDVSGEARAENLILRGDEGVGGFYFGDHISTAVAGVIVNQYGMKLSSNVRVSIDKILNVKESTSFPSSPQEGDIIRKEGNDENQHIYCYLNGSWNELI